MATDAFDVIAAITWGRDYGFMKEARDVDNNIQDMQYGMDYKAMVSLVELLYFGSSSLADFRTLV